MTPVEAEELVQTPEAEPTPEITHEQLEAALAVLAQKPTLIKAVLAQRAEEVANHQTKMAGFNAQLKGLGYKTTRAPRKPKVLGLGAPVAPKAVGKKK